MDEAFRAGGRRPRSMFTAAGWLMATWLALQMGVVTGFAQETAAERGYRALRTSQYLPPDFDEETFAELWTVWPEPERSEARRLTPVERRLRTMDYYGLVPDPADAEGTRPALNYVAGPNRSWVMSCLACHGGKVEGVAYPGAPNNRFALQTLTDDVRTVKLKQKKPLGHLEMAALATPLSATNGTTNSVIFGVILGALREPDLTVDTTRSIPHVVHHDVDAPPYWNVKKKTSLYVDGFAPKTHRPIMQFMLLPTNGRDTMYGWEGEFKDILAWIESVEAPKYPYPVDTSLAEQGRVVFEANCARCHGTYGDGGRYEQQTIPWDEIGTDRVRLDALTVEHRSWMQKGWMSRFGQDPVVVEPVGYVAPPLDGIWASAPYFHNGSVPTLWHVLHPDERPVVWKATSERVDQERVGLAVETADDVPATQRHPARRRWYFDTRLLGKSAAGHRFPDALTEPEKRAVLEYLKTL